jgi:DNA-binding transcriptional LysR family regulator
MNIKDFTYITAIVDCGSYSKAAEALYISQPSLSAYIRNLEKQLDIRFFENDRSHLTPAGEIYVSYARKIIALDRQLSDELARVKRADSGKIRIGITPGRSDQ